MKTLFTMLLMFGLVCSAKAELPYPPIIKDVDRSLQQYLVDLYNNRNVIPVTTTAPNGNRVGNKGELVIYNNSIWYNNSSTNSVLWLKL